MPRLNPSVSSVPRSGLLKATRRMKPKYTTIIAMVSEMATRHRAADTASSEEFVGIRGARIPEEPPIPTPENSKATPRPDTGQGVALSELKNDDFYFSGLSSGAPVPDEP